MDAKAGFLNKFSAFTVLIRFMVLNNLMKAVNADNLFKKPACSSALTGLRVLTPFQRILVKRSSSFFNRPRQAFLHQDVKSSRQIVAEPRIALYDEPVKISLKGFQDFEKITLHGQFTQGKENILFASCGHYFVERRGDVDVSSQPSQGGTYLGVEPMGIVWSLKPAPGQPEHTRMLINRTNLPFIITVKVYSGHLNLEEIYSSEAKIESLAEIDVERWFRFPDQVTRIEVEHGNVRGALFLPAGDGPFQGVIDVFGISGGLIEYRAALLASRGFAALALPYFRYKDLPETVHGVDFDYFEEAIEWFQSHPKVFKGGIGVVGVSKGGEKALCMTAYSKRVKAAVLINTVPYLSMKDLYYKKELLIEGAEFDINRAVESEEGALNISCAVVKPTEVIPSWQHDAKMLYFVSEDDYQFRLDSHQLFVQACPEEKMKNVEIVKYPGAGHLLEPPYTAVCRKTHSKAFRAKGDLLLFGGQTTQHAHAQEDAWQRTLSHLRKHIPSY